MICLGAGLTTGLISLLAETAPRADWKLARFAAISGTLSNVIPHYFTFSAIPHIGAGLAAIVVALSPVVTALLSVIFRVRPPSLLGLAGIVAGLLGAVIIVLARNGDLGGPAFHWLLLAFFVPLFLGIGNIYRTVGWPPGAPPMRLASLTNLAAVVPLLLLDLALNREIDLIPFAAAPGLAAAQVATSSIMFVMFFRLQQLGGPTYLSQASYVSAVIGVLIGVAGLHETYPASVWAGTAVVALGIGLTTLSQIRQARVN
jgi:drug/metabolite transporter (DMT)-like permease